MRFFPIRSAMLLAAVSLFLTGCAQNIVSPEAARSSGPGAGTLGGVRLPDPPEPIVGGPGATDAVTLAVGQAGTLHAGRFTLFIHQNSLKQGATVTMWASDPSSMQVEFTVTPAEANDFQVPPHVTADLSDLPSVDVTTQTMYYWEGAWEIPNDVIVDANAHTVMATMHQLSTCRVGDEPNTKKHSTN
jgi:hypothetical protein